MSATGTSSPPLGRIFTATVVLLGLGAVVGAIIYLAGSRPDGLPAPGSTDYEQASRRFHRGLAELEVGLLEGAIDQFTQATTFAPGEPASWANLGLTHLRLGAFDEAAPAIERAAALAPLDADVAFLVGRLETMRGRRDEGLAALRRAVELDEANLQARTALIQEIENAGGPGADDEAQRQLETLLALEPENAAVVVERARLAAKRGDVALLRDSVGRLAPLSAAWPPDVLDQYIAVQESAAAAEPVDAARAIAFLRNVLARVPEFLESRRRVTPSAELVAEPFARFLRLPVPVSTPAPADTALSFAAETLATAADTVWQTLVAFSPDGVRPPVVFVTDGASIARSGAPDSSMPFPGPLPPAEAIAPSVHALAAVDWNHDFRLDLVAAGPGGVRLYVQGADGTFVDDTARASTQSGLLDIDATGVWAVDIEMDGDLDLVIGRRDAVPLVLQNGGNGEWQPTEPLAGVTGLRLFAWADVDDDGDPDAIVVDGTGTLGVFINLQSGQFQRTPTSPGLSAVVALAVGDLNADGRIDVVTIDATGVVRRTAMAGDAWSVDERARWEAMPAATTARLFVADLDNNGALDVVASAGDETAFWLAREDLALTRLETPVAAGTWSVVDFDGDGRLDLAGLSAGVPVRLTGRHTRGYSFQIVRPRAQEAAGDQRVNSFGIGGIVEARAGLLVQKQVIAGPVVHMGLGTHSSVDVTRIVWPNGVPQAEFDAAADEAIVAEQRLKGSCPWIFTYDGTGMQFVTDFLWRSPLGLKINAQATANVTQTGDWVKIRGDQMVPRDGAYDIRISAELWETHFVDHVSLMVVDHPADVEVYVDERFVAGAPPALTVHALRPPRPVVRARDQAGRDVTDLVARRDGRYLDTFERGAYQGVAEDHFVEFEFEAPMAADAPHWIVAHGWVYPTDSSINVAIGQGGHVQPRGLSLEAQGADGRWVVVAPDLGFPAGKNKTVLIDLGHVARAGVRDAQRLRLRTNLEVYWDAIGYAEGVPDAALETTRLAADTATLRYRGFSQTSFDRRSAPETPSYDRIANVVPRWRDLTGYYTRFGDVRELIADVEDRYVIMNAGDELRLSFAAPAAPAPGWRRDFILIGDGWVKDGDYNTSYSKTVLPLPTHDTADYVSATPTPTLEQDPVYRRHREDWQTYHTRYVIPHDFMAGLAR